MEETIFKIIEVITSDLKGRSGFDFHSLEAEIKNEIASTWTKHIHYIITQHFANEGPVTLAVTEELPADTDPGEVPPGATSPEQ